MWQCNMKSWPDRSSLYLNRRHWISHYEKADILILGASYGSLFGTKLAIAGHA